VGIETVKLLKEKYHDVFYTILFSESPLAKAEHQAYYEKLVGLIEKHGLEENVAIIRGFNTSQILDAHIRINRLALFAYVSTPNHAVFGVSGAVRETMAKGVVACVSSNGRHFADCPSAKGAGPVELAKECARLFDNQEAFNAQLARQTEWVERNSWKNCAEKLLKVMVDAR